MSKKILVETEVTEDLSLDIPESWARTNLGTIGTTMIGLTYSPKDIGTAGVPVLRSGNIQKGKIDLSDLVRVSKAIRPNLFVGVGDILICARNGSRALVGKAARVKELPEAMTFGAFMAIYRSNLNDYIEIFLNSPLFRSHLEGVSTATINQITQNNLKTISIPLPPLAEQKRIVAKIEATTAKIEIIEKAADEAEKLLKKYRESILAKAFRGELVPQDPSEGTGHDLLARVRSESNEATTSKKKKKEELPPIAEDEVPFEIPKSWVWVRLGNIAKIGGGKRIPKGKTYSKTKTRYCYLRVADLKAFHVDETDIRYIDESVFNLISSYTITSKDIYVSVAGSIGISGKIPQSLDGANLTENADKISTYQAAFKQDFLIWLMNANVIQDQYRDMTRGAAQPKLSIENLKKTLCPLPPMGEQERILAELFARSATLEYLHATITNLKLRAKKLRESILTSAFSGKLVPQDPREGTGHELLAQIREAWTTAPDSDDAVKVAPKMPHKKSSKK